MLGALLIAATPIAAVPTDGYRECVPVAREISGIQIFGNANTWWDQAAGHYKRGDAPRVGSVLTFKPHGAMQLGHVAAVSRIVDDRTILVTHSNWSLINGERGQIERNVRVIDVSAANDWSAVRVWYAPLGDLGTTEWPTHGFIYAGADQRPAIAAPHFTQQRLEPIASPPAPTGRLVYLRKILLRL